MLECKEIIRSQLKNMSADNNGLVPARGFELAWELEREKMRIIQELLEALQNEKVLSEIENWRGNNEQDRN